MAKKAKNNKTMKRRNFLKGAGAAALGAATVSSFPAPAISVSYTHLTLPTDDLV